MEQVDAELAETNAYQPFFTAFEQSLKQKSGGMSGRLGASGITQSRCHNQILPIRK